MDDKFLQVYVIVETEYQYTDENYELVSSCQESGNPIGVWINKNKAMEECRNMNIAHCREIEPAEYSERYLYGMEDDSEDSECLSELMKSYSVTDKCEWKDVVEKMTDDDVEKLMDHFDISFYTVVDVDIQDIGES